MFFKIILSSLTDHSQIMKNVYSLLIDTVAYKYLCTSAGLSSLKYALCCTCNFLISTYLLFSSTDMKINHGHYAT